MLEEEVFRINKNPFKPRGLHLARVLNDRNASFAYQYEI